MSASHPLQTLAVGLRCRHEVWLFSPEQWLLLTVALALVFLAAGAWQRIALAVAVASSDTRSSLLRDAQWGKPETATAFRQRFGRGSSEADLVQWLDANHFQVDDRARRATLKVKGLPCAEDVAVSWTAIGGTINASRAVVSEAGCL
jgi:hypothetical protein